MSLDTLASSIRRAFRAGPPLSSLLALVGCGGSASLAADGAASDGSASKDEFREARERMVENQLAARGIHDARVLAAMRAVPRHAFVPEPLRGRAYEDRPLPIGHEQTISQPFVVAFMTQALELSGDERVLEIGTGSGYQAAVLAELVREVRTIEILEPLAQSARATLAKHGYENVDVRVGDGYQGWLEHAPFDAILVTAAPGHVPSPLVEQLALGGRMILPVGDERQELVLLRRTADGVQQTSVLPVRFVPMTGQAEDEDAK